MFNSHARLKTLEGLSQTTFDLFVVGGGITGAGVARDAIQRGLSVMLAEAKDFASGTSSRSSKLVHGGIRYLENFEFGLVHEALMERRHLLQMAPHMVHPLRFVIPVYKSSRVGLLKMEAGMILYDLLSMFEAPKLHEFHLAKSTTHLEPLLKADELKGSVVYSDAYMEDDRLVVETLRSAHRSGAQMANYLRVIEVQKQADGYRLSLCDELTQKVYTTHARHVVGCLGPWTDLFASQNIPDWKPVLRPTKGVHLVFAREKIPLKQAVVMAVEERIVFAIPREDIVIVGTTDTDFREDPKDVRVGDEDVRYLLSVTNRYFPEIHVHAADILSCYSGVRPLVKDGAQSEGKTSREHVIFQPEERLTLVAGGKYTTYRAMAEEIVDACLRSWSFEERMVLKKPQTTQPLNPAVTSEKIDRLLVQAEELAQELHISKAFVDFAIRRRGEEALPVLYMMAMLQGESESQRYWRAEAKFSMENEMCLKLVDFYTRRSPLFLFRKNHGYEYAEAVARIFTQVLGGGSPSYFQKAIQELDGHIADEMAAVDRAR